MRGIDLGAWLVLSAGCGARSGLIDDRGRDAGVDAAMDASRDEAGPDAGDGGDAGDAEPPVPCFPEPFRDPERELVWGEAPAVFPEYVQVVSTPLVVDFVPEPAGEEPVPEIVFVSYRRADEPGVLRVISGRAPLLEHMTLAGVGEPNDPLDPPLLFWNGHPAAGDLDGDGRPEIVVPKHDGGGLLAYRYDGAVVWESDDLPRREETDTPAVVIADLEGDGTPEVILGRSVLEADGSVRWIADDHLAGLGWLSCVADVDGDGEQEVIAGAAVYKAEDGAVLWRTSRTGQEASCAVADLFDADGRPGHDGAPEVVRVVSGFIRVHDGATGHQIAFLDSPDEGFGGPPTIADFDGDGLSEVGVAGTGSYLVWDVDQGEILWQTETEDDSSSVTGSTVFDFNGDGIAEVIYNDEQFFRVLDGADGSVRFEEPNPSRTRTELPVVADVDADGRAEIVFCANTEAPFAGDRIPPEERVPGLEVWGSGEADWMPARQIWNQHAYHITNVEEDGRIPAPEAPSWERHNTYRLNHALATFDPGDCEDGGPSR